MSTVALLKTYAPEFAAVDAEILQPFVDQAIRNHIAAPWGSMFADAMAYYAAHLFKMTPPNPATGTGGGGDSGAGGVGGPVTAQKDGDLSRSYANAAALSGGGGANTSEEAQLMETVYGRRYLAIRKTRATSSPGVVRT